MGLGSFCKDNFMDLKEFINLLSEEYPLSYKGEKKGKKETQHKGRLKDFVYTFNTKSGIKYEVIFSEFRSRYRDLGKQYETKAAYEISFYMIDKNGNKTREITGVGDAASVINTVISAVRRFINEVVKPKQLVFSSDKNEPSRLKLYTTIVHSKKIEDLGYMYRGEIEYNNFNFFVLKRK